MVPISGYNKTTLTGKYVHHTPAAKGDLVLRRKPSLYTHLLGVGIEAEAYLLHRRDSCLVYFGDPHQEN